MSLINTEIKPFKATAFHNGKFVELTEADVKGKWSVFFFYPADFTFVCPTELGDMADLYPEFQKLGVEVYSVSTDTHFTHKAWADASDTIKKINYPMIGDPTGAITRNFDVMIEEAGLALRGTFVVNRKARSRLPRSTIWASAVTPPSCCARSRLPSTSPPTRAKCARPSGPKAPRP
jgi:peroxiredoxin (alkyl hydroperoxide reductase subunit C)